MIVFATRIAIADSVRNHQGMQKLMSGSCMRKGTQSQRAFPECTYELYSNDDLIVETCSGQHINQWSKLTPPIIKHWYHVFLSVWYTEEDTASAIHYFCQECKNLNPILRKPHTSPNWSSFCRTSDHTLKMSASWVTREDWGTVPDKGRPKGHTWWLNAYGSLISEKRLIWRTLLGILVMFKYGQCIRY